MNIFFNQIRRLNLNFNIRFYDTYLTRHGAIICLKVPASQPSVGPSVHPSVGSPFGMSEDSDPIPFDPRPFGPKRKRRFGPKPFLTQDLSDTGAFRTETFSVPSIVFFMNLLGYRVCIHVCLSLCLFVCLCLFFICGWVSWTLSVDNLEQQLKIWHTCK